MSVLKDPQRLEIYYPSLASGSSYGAEGDPPLRRMKLIDPGRL